MDGNRTIAYLRISTADQDVGNNKSDILHLANEKELGKVEWVEEQASGRRSWRKREIAQVLEKRQPGDNLVVSELSSNGQRKPWLLKSERGETWTAERKREKQIR